MSRYRERKREREYFFVNDSVKSSLDRIWILEEKNISNSHVFQVIAPITRICILETVFCRIYAYSIENNS